MFKVYLVPLIGVCMYFSSYQEGTFFTVHYGLIRQYQREFSANLCRINSRWNVELRIS